MIIQNPFVEAFVYPDKKVLIYVNNYQIGLFDYSQLLNDGSDIKESLKKRYNTSNIIVNMLSFSNKEYAGFTQKQN